MKRVGGLLSRIAGHENLLLAFWKAAKGRRDSAAVLRLASNLDHECAVLGEEIRNGSVEVGRFHAFVVHDPKRRVIHAAPFRERMLHHAIMNICGPHFERGTIHDSYACRLGKGNLKALLQALRFSRGGGHFLKLDIRRYFDSVAHDVLKSRVHRLFKDPGLLHLLDLIIDSYETTPGTGLPIGTLTSQVFANFHLDALDQHVKHGLRCRRYVRFMDDFVLWHESSDQLENWKKEISEYLCGHLNLELKPGTRLGPVSQGLAFLGFRVLPDGLLLGRRARRRFRARLVEYEDGFARGTMDMRELQRRVVALVAHTDLATCWAWRGRALGRGSLEMPELS